VRPLLTPEEMKRADEAAISAGTPAEVLMDRAGRAVARVVIYVAGGRYGKRATVVCGKGNNGGDGFVVARCLHLAGLAVVCCPLFDTESLSGAPKMHFDRLVAAGCRVAPLDERFLECDVVVDAIFGTGFSGAVESPYREAIESINSSTASVVAVDIPSGVNGTNGQAGPPAIEADVTVCIAAEKVGTALVPGLDHVGFVEVADIGIATSEATALLIEAEDVAAWLPQRDPDAHKKSAGVVAVMAGSEEMPGAALLTARGALRSGAGYVRLGCVSAVRAAANVASPELLVRVVAEETFDDSSVRKFKDALEGAQAVAVGPGIGTSAGQRSFVESLLDSFSGPMVLDADALNVLASDPSPLLRRPKDGATIITPHPGELGRLLGRDASEIQRDRVGAATEARDRFGCTVLLKGRRTLVAAPGSPVLINPTGGPELAVGGSGDVLTGIVGTLLAAGLPPREAAAAAAYLHGVAGSVAKSRAGVPQGVLPSDVLEALPEAAALIAALPS
jgi:NAD(P)H-hydrate epimerase